MQIELNNTDSNANRIIAYTNDWFKLNDQVIELALKVVKFEEKSGKIISIDHEYESFNDPNEKLDEKITQITGITDEMVNGQSIDPVII